MMTPNDGPTHGEDFGGHGRSIFFHPSTNRPTASLRAPSPQGLTPGPGVLGGQNSGGGLGGPGSPSSVGAGGLNGGNPGGKLNPGPGVLGGNSGGGLGGPGSGGGNAGQGALNPPGPRPVDNGYGR